MGILKYKMYKNNVVFHESTCPILLFSHIVPIRYENFYDYIEVEYNGIIKIINPVDFSYHANDDISEEYHNEIIKFKRYVESTN